MYFISLSIPTPYQSLSLISRQWNHVITLLKLLQSLPISLRVMTSVITSAHNVLDYFTSVLDISTSSAYLLLLPLGLTMLETSCSFWCRASAHIFQAFAFAAHELPLPPPCLTVLPKSQLPVLLPLQRSSQWGLSWLFSYSSPSHLLHASFTNSFLFSIGLNHVT